MNKYIIILFFLSLLIGGCNDKNEPGLTISEADFYQTTWKAIIESYNNGQESQKEDYVVTFVTNSSGRYVAYDEKGNPYVYADFDYWFDDKMISFSEALGTDWTIIEKNDKKMVFESYQPQKSVMTLTKLF